MSPLPKFHSYQLALLLLTSYFFVSCKADKETHTSLFKEVSADSSGLHFTNQIQESAQANILTYQYFYNGGGVAVGDLNNDGFEDLYFTANQGQNKLFLNQGELNFRDITLATGTGGREQAWSTGAVIVDINADGLKDVYVCYSGDLPEEMRRNQLFVNQGLDKQGIPFFKEMAKDFGLDDPAFSTSAYFSDLDKDGDLDMLLLNHNPALFNNLNVNAFKTMMATPDPMSSSKVYRNENGKFRDVSAEIGIATGTLSYGLGASIADFNQDGWPDIYIGNDYSAPDYYYLNQGDGTFVDEVRSAFSHTSLYSMGVDVADFNRDGHLDLISLDMLPEDAKRQKLLHSPENYEHYELFVEAGLHHQLMRNMLQVNNGNGTFSEIGQAAGVAMTDWSWAPHFADFDNDGWQDLFVSNGFLKDFTNLDFINYREQVLANPKAGQQQILELIAAMPATKLGNYAFKNKQGGTFEKVSKDWGLDTPGNSNGAAYADLDGDGDLELIVNNLNEPSRIFKNLTREREGGHFLQIKLEGEKGNPSGLGAKVWVFSGNTAQYQEQSVYRGFQGNVSEILHFGLENPSIDSLRVQWPNGKVQTLFSPKEDQRLTLKVEDASAAAGLKPTILSKFQLVQQLDIFRKSELHVNDFKRQSQLLYSLSQNRVFFGKGDLNGDGESDLVFATSTGDLMWFDGKTEKVVAVPLLGIPPTVSGLLCFDADDDGDLDIYLASGGYGDLNENDPALRDQLLINDGEGSFQLGGQLLPERATATSEVVIWDFDGDGQDEIFVGGGYTPGRWPESAPSYLLKKSGSRYEIHSEPILDALERVKDAIAYDLDGDGMKELIVASEFDRLRVVSAREGKLTDRSEEFFPQGKTGLWRSLLLEDLDGDGSPELLAGNWGLNSRLRTEPEMPVRLYFADFDQNGSVDPMMTFPIGGAEIPFLSRDELTAQMYRKKALFPKHEAFANASIAEILTPEELSRAAVLQVETLETQLFSLKEGQFRPQSLPSQAQYAPVNVALAIKKDQAVKDLLLLGNLDQARLKIGKQDANQGLLLSLDSDSNSWFAVPQSRSGFQLKGEVNSAEMLGDKLWLGLRDQGLMVFKMNQDLK